MANPPREISERDRELSRLMGRSQVGDGAAYEVVLNETAVMLKRYLYRRVADEGAREDVLQEILLSVHKARHTFDPNLSYKTWLFSIARFRLIDYYRKSNRQRSREISQDSFEDFFTQEEGAERETDRLDPEVLLKALDALPPAQKEAVDRLKYREQSVREAAEAMGRTESSVKVLAHRGYKALRKVLLKRGEGE